MSRNRPTNDVSKRQTARDVSAADLTPTPALSGADIRALRHEQSISQAVLARYLNVSTGLISQWEREERHPTGTALKLLALVRAKGLKAVA